MSDEIWSKIVGDLRVALADDVGLEDVVLEAESVAPVGAVLLDVVVEASSSDLDTQLLSYRILCDILATRVAQGAGQVLGLLVISGPPNAEALLAGLDGMLGADGTFTPVLPLSPDQTRALIDAGAGILDLIDPATALLEIAASRTPKTVAVATGTLDEIDELIARYDAKR